MQHEYKHPQIFADVLAISQLYYPLHNRFPKPVRFAVGERLLGELAECARLIILANLVDKQTTAGRSEGATFVRRLRASIEVIRGYLLVAWQQKFLSHGAITELSTRLESVSRQAARWQQWFERATGGT